MSMTPVIVQDYASRPSTEKRDVRNFRQRLHDAHEESVTVGVQGPVILILTFVSSTLTLLYRGAKYIYSRCVHG